MLNSFLKCENQELDVYTPTVVDIFVKKVNLKSGSVILMCNDTAGQEEYSRLRLIAYTGCHVFLVCFDISCQASFLHVKQWMTELHDYLNEDTVVVLVGCKSDNRDANVPCITPEEGCCMAQAIGAASYMECSARKLLGCSEVFISGASCYFEKQSASYSATNVPSVNLCEKRRVRRLRCTIL
eukprot:TRINITY_DN10579_c0_g2_i2.p1 TRINITY_DN10579_c0_g2~~TRINITY_DN10579_c0_g2_i2.p1  ORF type:complete len:183 (+),score=19.46 TRINITY_DN10579_c0_g2_i2:98-646(+)